ncbi:HHIP-like protein 1 [Ciona intestinalis]
MLHLLILLPFLITTCKSHPQCIDTQAPFTPGETFILCREYQNFGCCNDDAAINARFNEIMNSSSVNETNECVSFIQNILCQVCSPYAAHLYDAEGSSTPKTFPSLCPTYLNEFNQNCSHLTSLLTLDSQSGVVSPQNSTYCYPDTLISDTRTTNLGNLTSDANCDVLCVQEVANNFYTSTSAKPSNDGTHRMFIVEQKGVIWIYLSNFTKVHPPFMDWRPSVFARPRTYDERGLLDIAFHPQFRENGRFYIYYTRRLTRGHGTTLSEFTVSTNDMNLANASSEKVILDIRQPAFNHNGGNILFYEGLLYLFTGDGGKAGDPWGNAQNKKVLLGKALRIDVDSTNTTYSIPPDNPYVSGPNVRDEIFAYGLRNPWKCALDRGDPATGAGFGRIFCGDVGQDDFEEVDIVVSGGNYGWNQIEGHACFKKSCIRYPNNVEPIHVYDHNIGRSITGGYVYRGCDSPNLNGLYIFADWFNGRLFYLREQTNGWISRNICMGGDDYCVGNGLTGSYFRFISSFVEDEKGEVYFLTTNQPNKEVFGGRMYKIVDPSRRGSPTQCNQQAVNPVVFNENNTFEHYQPITENSLEVRLVNDRDGQLKRGRVEIRKPGGVWGTVCDDRWDVKDANILCKMAGYKRARRAFLRAYFGRGSGPVYLDDLRCRGGEISLLDCAHTGWGVANCDHSEDAGVICI